MIEKPINGLMRVVDGSPQSFCCNEMKDHWEKDPGVGSDEYHNCKIYIITGGGFRHNMNITHCPWCGNDIYSMVYVQ